MSESTSADGRSLSRQEFEKEVLLRAHSDPAFRQQLLADPRAALQATFGLEMPPETEIQVLEETPSRFYIVLPSETAELSDEEVARVAGGAVDYFSPLHTTWKFVYLPRQGKVLY